MRITESVMAYDFLFNINRTRDRINTEQSQLASMRRVSKVSDDPTATDSILRIQAGLDRNAQYSRNVSDAQGMLETTASTMDDFTTLMQRVQEIMTQATDGNQTSSMSALAENLDGILNEGVALANTKFNGKYIFGGTETQRAPYTLVTNPGPPPTQTVTYNGNANPIQYMVGEGITQTVNVTGQDLFQGTAIFQKIMELRDSLRAGTPPTAADVTTVGDMLKNSLQGTSKAGSYLQSLTSTAMHLEEQRIQMLALLSIQQDTDIGETTLKLKQDQTALEAALATGAKILPKSLVDFLG
jgi:flagellar hook-associated protein 3 FlgL